VPFLSFDAGSPVIIIKKSTNNSTIFNKRTIVDRNKLEYCMTFNHSKLTNQIVAFILLFDIAYRVGMQKFYVVHYSRLFFNLLAMVPTLVEYF